MSWRPPDYRCAVDRQWIDYNGHLRDAYYTLIFSQAIDALMDEIGLDQAYRERTGGTLYTLEMHVHFLSEVKASDEIRVGARALGVDRQAPAPRLSRCIARATPNRRRSPNSCCCTCGRLRTRKSAPFPPEVLQRLETWHASDAQAPAPGPRIAHDGARPALSAARPQ